MKAACPKSLAQLLSSVREDVCPAFCHFCMRIACALAPAFSCLFPAISVGILPAVLGVRLTVQFAASAGRWSVAMPAARSGIAGKSLHCRAGWWHGVCLIATPHCLQCDGEALCVMALRSFNQPRKLRRYNGICLTSSHTTIATTPGGFALSWPACRLCRIGGRVYHASLSPI